MAHTVEHSVNLWNNILAIDIDRCAFGSTKCNMQCRPLFCDVYFLTSEHGIHPNLQSGFYCQCNEELQRLGCDPVLGIVQIQASTFSGHPLAAHWIAREEFTKMEVFNFLIVILECLPSRLLRWGRSVDPPCVDCHSFSFRLLERSPVFNLPA